MTVIRLWACRLWARVCRRWLFVDTEDVPSRPKNRRVYLISDDGEVWQVAFICPCGCRETIQLSVIPESRPRWRFDVHENGTITLHPSINRVVGCKSHFFLRCGSIEWCPSAGTLAVFDDRKDRQ